MSTSIDVCLRNPYDNEVWRQSVSPDEWNGIKGLCNDTSDRFVSWDKSLLYPVRTNTVSNTMRDLIMPTVARMVAAAVGPLFIVLAGIIDAVTLPIRCLTLLPRMVVNSGQPENSLVTYLKTKNVDTKFYCGGCARIEAKGTFDGSIQSGEQTAVDGTKYALGIRNFVKYTKTVTWIDVPEGTLENSYFDESSCRSIRIPRAFST